MSYSVDLRNRVIDFLNAGYSQEETSLKFNVGTTTIKRWLSLLSETGSLEKKPLNKAPSVFESEKSNSCIEANPDALLKDIAQHFDGSVTGAFYALKREKITYKKRIFYKEKDCSGIWPPFQ